MISAIKPKQGIPYDGIPCFLNLLYSFTRIPTTLTGDALPPFNGNGSEITKHRPEILLR